MADVSKLRSKRPGGLGSPPGPDDVATSLNAPEVAPAAQTENPKAIASDPVTEPYIRRDGRSARKTNRTLAFATRVTPEFDKEIRDIADREELKLVEVLEKAVEAYKEKMGY